MGAGLRPIGRTARLGARGGGLEESPGRHPGSLITIRVNFPGSARIKSKTKLQRRDL
jgi:hypothetical protein